MISDDHNHTGEIFKEFSKCEYVRKIERISTNVKMNFEMNFQFDSVSLLISVVENVKWKIKLNIQKVISITRELYSTYYMFKISCHIFIKL